MVWLIAVLILSIVIGFYFSWKVGVAVGGIGLLLLLAVKARGGRTNGSEGGGFWNSDGGGDWGCGGVSDGGGDCGGGDGGGGD